MIEFPVRLKPDLREAKPPLTEAIQRPFGEEAMSRIRKAQPPAPVDSEVPGYDDVLSGMVELLESARRSAARAVKAIMTATYWEIGRRIVTHEQRGHSRAAYGKTLLSRLSTDLTQRAGRGFSVDNLELMRRFYLTYPTPEISETPSRKSASGGKSQTPSGEFAAPQPAETMDPASATSPVNLISRLAHRFPLPWSHYVRLLKVAKPEARAFYEAEALCNGWTARQLDRQVTTLYYERTLASWNKAAMLQRGAEPRPEDRVTPEEEIKDPLVLEFLGLKDEYSQHELRRRSSSIWRASCWSSAATSPSWAGRSVSALAMSGIGSTCYSITAGCAAWSSSTSSSISSPTPTPVRCTST
jgi:hypothetical protein